MRDFLNVVLPGLIVGAVIVTGLMLSGGFVSSPNHPQISVPDSVQTTPGYGTVLTNKYGVPLAPIDRLFEGGK